MSDKKLLPVWRAPARHPFLCIRQKPFMIFRLEPTVQINDNWTAHSRIQYTADLKTNDENTDSTAKMNRAWVEGDIGAVHTKVGKLPTFSSQGVIMTEHTEVGFNRNNWITKNGMFLLVIEAAGMEAGKKILHNMIWC